MRMGVRTYKTELCRRQNSWHWKREAASSAVTTWADMEAAGGRIRCPSSTVHSLLTSSSGLLLSSITSRQGRGRETGDGGGDGEAGVAADVAPAQVADAEPVGVQEEAAPAAARLHAAPHVQAHRP